MKTLSTVCKGVTLSASILFACTNNASAQVKISNNPLPPDPSAIFQENFISTSIMERWELTPLTHKPN